MADKKADKKPVATQKFGDDRKKALETAIAVALEQDDDVKIGGGATH